eukprot:TRINITY_DN3586_c1_g2_i1.p1 TRINITY_DN3586_c1_g2~~TRINITY_DN3586_c1_g2_i1.p1  ORF type:complete len:897 (+),score=214.45 TRINITY_DN3586_c1_g2_i1:51-2693(+)
MAVARFVKSRPNTPAKVHSLEPRLHGHTDPFNVFPDYSKQNERCHQANRANTFLTPPGLDRRLERTETPAASESRESELLWICEQGIGKTIRSLRKDLHQDLQDYTLQLVRDELHKQLTPLSDRLGVLQKDATESMRNVDMSPIRDELQQLRSQGGVLGSAEAQKEFMNMMSDVAKGVQILKDNAIDVDARMKALELEVHVAAEASERYDQELGKLSEFQAAWQASSMETSQGVSTLLQKSEQGLSYMSTQEVVTKELDSRMDQVEHMVQKVKQQVQETNKSLHSDIVIVVNEIGKIQKAMNVDFVSVLTSIKDEMTEVRTQQRESLSSRASVCSEVTPLDLGKPKNGSLRGDEALSLAVQKRYRDYFAQTETKEMTITAIQTDPVEGLLMNSAPKKKKKPKPKNGKKVLRSIQTAQPTVFADADAINRKARKNLIKPQYNVSDNYYDTGYAQAIARSALLEYITMAVIVLNALWIAIDTDLNTAPVIIMADPVFQVAEHTFCTYFFLELLVRFAAFERKLNCFRDSWFVFDLLLVTMMVAETWVFSIVLVATGQNDSNADIGSTSVLRIGKIARILRISRIARLLRAIPELVVLVKGIALAARSVTVFFGFWLAIIYVFALAFRQLTDGQVIGERYFSSVIESMNTLLLRGILPDFAAMVDDLTDANVFLWPLIVFFLLLASVTVMYMLMGVLVDVTGVIASTEKEAMVVRTVAEDLREAMAIIDKDTDRPFSKLEFETLLQEPEVCKIVEPLGVDVVVVTDMLDMIFEAKDRSGQAMYFEDFVDLMLNSRGGNSVTMKDANAQLTIVKQLVKHSSEALMKRLERVSEKVMSELDVIRAQNEDYGRNDSESEMDNAEARQTVAGDDAPDEAPDDASVNP